MRFKGLDLNLLLALDALFTEQNVSAAAERLHLSQSAMSGVLRRLRECFQDELLVNMNRRMILTPRAQELVEPVRDLLLRAKSILSKDSEFDPATASKSVSIQVSDYALTVAIAGALSALSRAAPGLRFEVCHPVDMVAAERLERGAVDLLLTIERAAAEGHPREVLFEDDFVVIAWSDNAVVGAAISEEEYFNLGHVAVYLGVNRTPSFDHWFVQSSKQPRRIEMYAPSFVAVPQLIVGTDRIATVHRRLAVHFARVLPLKILPVPFEIPTIRQVCQWHALNDTDQGLRWIVRFLREYCEQQDAAVNG